MDLPVPEARDCRAYGLVDVAPRQEGELSSVQCTRADQLAGQPVGQDFVDEPVDSWAHRDGSEVAA